MQDKHLAGNEDEGRPRTFQYIYYTSQNQTLSLIQIQSNKIDCIFHEVNGFILSIPAVIIKSWYDFT